MEDGSYEWISSQAGELGVLGVSKHLDKVSHEFSYIIAVEEIKGELPKGYISATIPAMTWAVFESVGALPEAPQNLMRRIFVEWMPSAGYQHACIPEIEGVEVYPIGDCYSKDYKCEIWIPVRK
jgi:AraC family transcriptional regulator